MPIIEFECRDVAQYHYMQALNALLKDDHDNALICMEQSLENMATMDGPYSSALSELGIVHILCELGRLDEAEDHINKAHILIESINDDSIEFYLNLAEADLALARGDDATLKPSLQQALQAVHGLDTVNHYLWQTKVMERLCDKAITIGVESEVARQLLENGGIPGKSSGSDQNIKYFPVHIYTLGRFTLVVDGKQVQFTTKAQKKPLELLKALIAYGGREVSEVFLCDALWPDKEGDTTHSACATTLHRLRKLLGYDAAILYHDAKLTLNADICWVDAWQFERFVGKGEEGKTTVTKNERMSMLEQAVGLYHGLFLEADKSLSWTLGLRERLRSKYLRAIQALGQHYGSTGMCDQAITVYEKGLETDSLAESFYYQLMLCYAGIGDVPRALETYLQCRHILSTILGIEPSTETRALYQNLRNGDCGNIDMNCQRCRNNTSHS